MTNAMIIMLESIKLMEDGVIKGSGIKGLTQDGKEIELPEALHTYQVWKSLGYQVKKGSKAVAQFPIWKYMTKKVKTESEDIDPEALQNKGYCRMVTASFFTVDQVEKLKVNSK